jgi:hypothetical protein
MRLDGHEAPPPIRWGHLDAMTGDLGLYEHAEGDQPRLEAGYTTDDNARAVVILAGFEPDDGAPPLDPYLDFVVAARVPFGFHNRMSDGGDWTDRRGPDDTHGRAMWGLGAALAAGRAGDDAAAAFLAGLDLDSPYPRSNAYALIGATLAHSTGLFGEEVETFVERVAERIPRGGGRRWPWPETALTYDNARIPQALMLAGRVIGDPGMVDDGLALLEWLVATESGSSGFSFTPVGGRGPGETGPAFDQQPIEAWAMADACITAWEVDPSPSWLAAAEDAALWFMGRNDTGAVLYDTVTGAGYDGLEADGVNLNRGAESTLAALGALRALDLVRARV